MRIPVSRVSDEFRFFPYSPDHENGRTNNGGIDLVREPHRVDEITELAEVLSLRQIVTDHVRPDSPFMTLGVDAGPRDGFFDGYLEFAFRNAASASEENYRRLIDSFCDWVSTEFPETADSIFASFVADLQYFHLHGVPHGDRMTVWFHTMNREACDPLLRILAHFLVTYRLPSANP